jgi:hypothetical protein
MKHLFNNISQEDKKRILEMHSGKKNTILEQSKMVPYGSKPAKHPTDSKLWINMINDTEGEGPSIIKETPNQLIIDGLSGTWTITFTK